MQEDWFYAISGECIDFRPPKLENMTLKKDEHYEYRDWSLSWWGKRGGLVVNGSDS